MNLVEPPEISRIKNLSLDELSILCEKIRAQILKIVSENGGHLSSALGAVEIITAMHHVFDENHPFIFDTSHQAYAHKLLTGRWQDFATLRRFGGISGFTNPKESARDFFIAGHASTSISLGVGAARAFRIRHQREKPVILIGDGAMSSGIIYEALNELGVRKYPMIILLNDNEMSISKPFGAMSRHLSKLMSGAVYQGIRGRIKKLLMKMPRGASFIARRFEESFKLITPGILFEEFGVHYIGPIDGHNLKDITQILKIAKNFMQPVLVHLQTTKGKGYAIAEGPHEHWHGVSPFDLSTGAPKNLAKKTPPTKIFSSYLVELARADPKIVGVTAAMPGGTGLSAAISEFPERFFDVGIAEAHAVTSMCAMAKEGFKPFVAIYSTFLQRAYDHIVHDACILNLPVVFAIDRAGFVGEDGETHQGLLDVAYLRAIPNITFCAPRDLKSLKKCMNFAANFPGTLAFRFPRGAFVADEDVFEDTDFALGESELLGSLDFQILLVGFGNGVGRAWKIHENLRENGVKSAVLDIRFVKPLDPKIAKFAAQAKKIYVFSDNYAQGGVASALLEFLHARRIFTPVVSFEVADEFILHGDTKNIEQKYLNHEKILSEILKEK